MDKIEKSSDEAGGFKEGKNNEKAVEKKVISKIKIMAATLTALLLLVTYLAYTGYKRDKAIEYKDLGVKSMVYGDFNQAIDYFGKSIEADRKFAPAYYLTGVSYYYKYKYADTFSFMDRNEKERNNCLNRLQEYITGAIKLKKDYPAAHIYLGVYYCEKKLYDEAKKEFDMVINMAEKNPKENKIKKWSGYASKANLIISGKDKTGGLLIITDETVNTFTNKYACEEKSSIISYLKDGEFSEKELLNYLKDFNFSSEEIKVIIEKTDTKIPAPPEPDEFKVGL